MNSIHIKKNIIGTLVCSKSGAKVNYLRYLANKIPIIVIDCKQLYSGGLAQKAAISYNNLL